MKNLTNYINDLLIYEGFFNSLFGTGTEVKCFINKIKLGIETLRNNDKKTAFGKLDPSLFKYDEKQKNIIYTGEVDSSTTGIYQNKPILKGVKISSHLSEKEMKELAVKFGKTLLGQEIYKYSDEFKKDLAEKKKKQENDPEYQGRELASLVNEYYMYEIWKDKKKTGQYAQSMNKLISKYRDSSGKFNKGYEDNIQFCAKHSSKLNSNLHYCETVKDVEVNIIGKYLNNR